MTTAPLDCAERFSDYARASLQGNSALRDEIANLAASPFSPKKMADALHNADDSRSLAAAMRRLRRRVFLTTMTRDLNGDADLAEVISTMTALADLCIARGAEILFRELAERHGNPAQPLAVVAMGKLGGGELNVSSDIDLIFLYPRADANAEQFFVRLGRRLIALLEQPDENGFVFRVDMRLRPYGGDGRLAVSYAELEKYFYETARGWERYAWIKARVVIGEARELEEIVTPFVYRKYLDVGTVDDIRRMREQIRAESSAKAVADNIKIGRGGIRDIEFFAQAFQLLRGGQHPPLQTTRTLDALAELSKQNWVEEKTAQTLADCYDFFRRLEHRLQYRADRQTCDLPRDSESRRLIAEAMEFADFNSLANAVNDRREIVSRAVDGLLDEPTQSERPLIARAWQSDDAESLSLILAAAGLGRDSPAAAEQLLRIKKGRVYRQLSPPRQESVADLIPPLVAAAVDGAHPPELLGRLKDALETLARHSSYLNILLRYPEVFSDMAKLFGAGSWAFKHLKARPDALVRLVEGESGAPDWQRESDRLAAQFARASADEERLEILRVFKDRAVLRVLMAEIFENLPVASVSDRLSELADIVLSRLLEFAWESLGDTRHRENPQFAAVGYGRLGAKEMGYGSDLDLIFLYEDDRPEAAAVYAKLARRLLFLLGEHGGAGLYDVDLRLRPDGAGGVTVSSLDGFADYQRKSAQLWEHQALTRARFIAGDESIGEKFERDRIAILTMPRDPSSLAREIAAMRGRIVRELGARDPAKFDLKRDPGGMIDVEFVAQHAVLAHSSRVVELRGNIGTLALLRRAAAAGILPADLAAAAHDSYTHYRRIAHFLRLDERPLSVPMSESLGRSRARVIELWDTAIDALCI